MRTIRNASARPPDDYQTDKDAEIVADGLLTVTASATFLNMSRSKLYELMDSGELRHVKLGRARRIPRRALVELAAKHLCGGWRGGES